ncbi:MAG: hypothetical protein PHX03_05290 [Bacilli bacterium]|nr:hypothetical protein [Bacilli bacterium]
MNLLNILKELLPYAVSIIASIIAYFQAKKKLTQELEIVKTNNKHEIEKLMQQHKINIEDLKEKHRLEMEAKDKEYQHEKEMLELKSKVTIDEKNQEVMNNAMSGIVGGIFTDVISGKISPEQINDLAKKFPNKNNS